MMPLSVQKKPKHKHIKAGFSDGKIWNRLLKSGILTKSGKTYFAGRRCSNHRSQPGSLRPGSAGHVRGTSQHCLSGAYGFLSLTGIADKPKIRYKT